MRQEFEVVQPGQPHNGAKDDDDKDSNGRVEQSHQRDQPPERAGTISADHAGDRAEYADACNAHDQPHPLANRMPGARAMVVITSK